MFCNLPDGTVCMCSYSYQHEDADFMVGDTVILAVHSPINIATVQPIFCHDILHINAVMQRIFLYCIMFAPPCQSLQSDWT